MQKIHRIKLLQDFADPVMNGEKRFEIRFNDRGYQKGDWVRFKIIPREEGKSFPIEEEMFEITYVVNGFGLKNGYVVFGIRRMSRFEVLRALGGI